MPPIPHVKLYFVASRLTLAGCRWKKTFDSTLSAQFRGLSSFFTRNIERYSCVFSGCFSSSTCCLAFSSSVLRRAAASSFTLSRTPVLFLSPFSSAICLTPSQLQNPPRLKRLPARLLARQRATRSKTLQDH